MDFNSEVAILQNIFRSLENVYGSLNLSDQATSKSLKAHLQRALNDIHILRQEEFLSPEECEHLDRKLVTGLFYAALRNLSKVVSSCEFFWSLEDVYPHFEWDFLLELINHCRWENHFIECLSYLHYDFLTIVLSEILKEFHRNTDAKAIKITVKILFMLVDLCFNCEGSVDSNAYSNNFSQFLSFLKGSLQQLEHWEEKSKKDLLSLTLTDLQKLSLKFGKVSSFDSLKDSKLGNSSVNEDTLDEFFSLLCDRAVEQEFDVKQLELFLKYSEISMSLLNNYCADNYLTDLSRSPGVRICKFHLNNTAWLCILKQIKINIEYLISSQLSDESFTDVKNRVEAVLKNVTLIVQHSERELIPSLKDSNAEIGIHKNIVEDIIKCKDESELNLLLDDLKVALHLNRYQLKQLLEFLKDADGKTGEKIKQILLQTYLSWTWILRWQFHSDLLMDFGLSEFLSTAEFSSQITIVANQMVASDLKNEEFLLNQLACLCIQSASKTLYKIIEQSINSSAQVELAVKILHYLHVACKFQTTSGLTCLASILGDFLKSRTLTQSQQKNVVHLIRILMKLPSDNGDLSYISAPLLQSKDLIEACILPAWQVLSTEHLIRIHLGVQLLMVCHDSDDKEEMKQWLIHFSPFSFLYYLCNIISFCGRIIQSGVSWVFIKNDTVDIINKLVEIILEEPTTISENQLVWIVSELQQEDLNTIFYLNDLLCHFKLQRNLVKEQSNHLMSLFDFAVTSPKHCSEVLPHFNLAVKDLNEETYAKVILALLQTLPRYTTREWTLISQLLKDSSFSEYLLYPLETSLYNEPKKDSVYLISLIRIFIDVILIAPDEICQKYLISCFTLVAKDLISDYVKHIPDDRMKIDVDIEIFREICRLCSSLPQNIREKADVLMLEINPAGIKDHWAVTDSDKNRGLYFMTTVCCLDELLLQQRYLQYFENSQTLDE